MTSYRPATRPQLQRLVRQHQVQRSARQLPPAHDIKLVEFTMKTRGVRRRG